MEYLRAILIAVTMAVASWLMQFSGKISKDFQLVQGPCGFLGGFLDIPSVILTLILILVVVTLAKKSKKKRRGSSAGTVAPSSASSSVVSSAGQ